MEFNSLNLILYHYHLIKIFVLYLQVNYAMLSCIIHYCALFALLVPEPCNETGAIRLTHGEVLFSDNSVSGRLEVCSGGQWGSVCYSDETTNGNIGKVACRELNQTARGKK